MRTIYTQDLIEISLESNENLDALVSLLEDEVENRENLKSSHVFPLFCELIWINSSILLTLRRVTQDLTFKDEDQKEVILNEVILQSLTTLLIARWQATSELTKFSYSLSLH